MFEHVPRGCIENRSEYFFDSHEELVRQYEQVSELAQDILASFAVSANGYYQNKVTRDSLLQSRQVMHSMVDVAGNGRTLALTDTDLLIDYEQQRHGVLEEAYTLRFQDRITAGIDPRLLSAGPGMDMVVQPYITQDPFYANYYLERYVGGKIFALVERSDVIHNSEEREGLQQMIPYDFHELEKRLRAVLAIQQAEVNERAILGSVTN